MTGKFIVTRGKATELLETSEQVFDQMPSAIALCTDAPDIFNQSLRVVAFVRNDSARIFIRYMVNQLLLVGG